MNRLKYFLLLLDDCMMETYSWLEAESTSIGGPITATRMLVG